MVSGFPEQTVERRGSLVFCVGKSSEVERERMVAAGANERVCGECPTPMLIRICKMQFKLIVDVLLVFPLVLGSVSGNGR